MFIVQPKEPGAWLERILVEMAININTRMRMRMRMKMTVATLQTICPGTPAISQAPVQPAQDPI